MQEQKLTSNTPWGMIGLIAVVSLIGLLGVYSAPYSSRGVSSIFYKQLMWIGIGMVIMFAMLIPNYHTIGRYAYTLYWISVAMLLLVMLIGRTGMGAQRWLALGPIAFQPSELAKLAVALSLARFFSSNPRPGGYRLTDLGWPAAMVALPLVMVLKQPDLGTAMMLLITSSIIVIVAGLRVRSIIIIAIAGITLASSVFLIPPVKNTLWGSLKPYQQKRIKAFIDPASDSLGSGYHANQSRIAVGSGRVTGKGFGQGTQSQLAFLPERHTDFIFAVIAEERGLIGAGFLIMLYLALLLYGIEAAKNAKDRLGALMASGVVSLLAVYFFINIGMAVGVAPVVGVPLPLASYGGTAIITTFLSLGLLLNIHSKRFMLFY